MPLVRRRGSSPSGLSVIEAAEPPEGETGLVWRNNGVYKVFLNSAWKDIDFYDGEWAAGTGGDTVVDVGGYRYHKFTTAGNAPFICSQAGDIEYLIVAGGGGGAGARYSIVGGTGGGGGVLNGKMSVSAGQVLTVAVGGGGAKGSGGTTSSPGSNGGNSLIDDIVAYGGGGGGAAAADSTRHGKDGASGGGGGCYNLDFPASGGVGIPGQGHDGQDSDPASNASGLGGGAASAGNAGGYGKEVWGATYSAGGKMVYSPDVDVEANTGNGGDAGTQSKANGAPGSSGIVVIRYAI